MQLSACDTQPAKQTAKVKIGKVVVERVVHKLVEEKHAVEASMLPLDGGFHSIEHVKEVWNLVDVQVVLIIAVLEQLYTLRHLTVTTVCLGAQAISEIHADYRDERHDGFGCASVDRLVTFCCFGHDGFVTHNRAGARFRPGDLHRLLLRVLLDDRHVHLLVVGVRGSGVG